MNEKEINENSLYISLNIFIFFTSIYLMTLSGTPFQADISYIRFDVAESIVERFDVTVRDGLGVRGADGRDYSWIGLGSALVSVPFYLIGKFSGVPPEAMISLVNPLFGALTAVLLFIFVSSLGYPQRVAFAVTLCYGLGTIAWPQTKQPFDHPVETFFVLLSFYTLQRYLTENREIHVILSGIAAGMAFLTRATTLFLIPSLIVMLFVHRYGSKNYRSSDLSIKKSAVLFNFGFLPVLGISLWYNQYRFGSVFETGYSLIADRLGLDFFTGTSMPTGLVGLLLSPGKGFFFYSPVAIFFFLSIRSFRKKYPALAAGFIALTLSYLIFLSKNIYWHGDWTWGPRYLLAITPLLMVPVAEFIVTLNYKKISIKYLFYFIFSLSVLIQTFGVVVDFRKHFHNLATIDRVEFIISRSEGAPTVGEPPAEIYFDLKHSPIFRQFLYVWELGNNLAVYASNQDEFYKSPLSSGNPAFYLYDFWWLFLIVLNGKQSAILAPLALAVVLTYTSYKLKSKL